jgi:hypothetical protein
VKLLALFGCGHVTPCLVGRYLPAALLWWWWITCYFLTSHRSVAHKCWPVWAHGFCVLLLNSTILQAILATFLRRAAGDNTSIWFSLPSVRCVISRRPSTHNLLAFVPCALVGLLIRGETQQHVIQFALGHHGPHMVDRPLCAEPPQI